MLPPQLGTIRATIIVRALEDPDPVIVAGRTAGRLLLRPQVLGQGPEHPVVVFGRELAAGNAEVAGDAGLRVEHPVVAVERMVVCLVAHVKLPWMADGIGRVVWVVEEAEINRFEEPSGAFPQRQLGVGHHRQRDGQPGIVHRGQVRLDPAGVKGGDLEDSPGAGVQHVEEEPVGPIHACQRREGPVQS